MGIDRAPVSTNSTTKPRRTRVGLATSPLYVIPAILVAIMPKCPLCVGIYASVLASVGLQVQPWKYVRTGSIALLFLALFLMAYRARRRHRYGPLIIGLMATVALLLGKFLFQSPLLTFLSLGLFFAASVWSTVFGGGSHSRRNLVSSP